MKIATSTIIDSGEYAITRFSALRKRLTSGGTKLSITWSGPFDRAVRICVPNGIIFRLVHLTSVRVKTVKRQNMIYSTMFGERADSLP